MYNHKSNKERQNKKEIMSGSSSSEVVGFGDTTLTKIFIGGLAWATQRDSIRRYFERFGPIVEAAVISDKRTGRSKGYGFVTFKHPDSAMKACENPYPVIDGRRTNCNLAAFGAQKNPPLRGSENLRPSSQSASNSLGVSTYLCGNTPEFYAFPYSSAYRYPYPSQDVYVMNYDNSYGVGYYVPIYGLQGQSSETKMSENPSQLHVYQPLYVYETGPTEMAATSELGFGTIDHNKAS